MEHRVYVYDHSGGYGDAGDYLYKAEVQPPVLAAGQFIVGYSDESTGHAAERCVAACEALAIGGEEFVVELPEEEPSDGDLDLCDTRREESLLDGEGYDGLCGNCADVKFGREED